MAVGRKGKMKAHYLYFFPFFRNSTQFRRVFERWTQWQPGHEVWRSYVNFEDRVASAAASAAAASFEDAAALAAPFLSRAASTFSFTPDIFLPMSPDRAERVPDQSTEPQVREGGLLG